MAQRHQAHQALGVAHTTLLPRQILWRQGALYVILNGGERLPDILARIEEHLQGLKKIYRARTADLTLWLVRNGPRLALLCVSGGVNDWFTGVRLRATRTLQDTIWWLGTRACGNIDNSSRRICPGAST